MDNPTFQDSESNQIVYNWKQNQTFHLWHILKDWSKACYVWMSLKMYSMAPPQSNQSIRPPLFLKFNSNIMVDGGKEIKDRKKKKHRKFVIYQPSTS